MQKLIDGELHSKETILQKYDRLVLKHATRYCGNDHHYKEDLKQEGRLGLIKAFEKYDTGAEIKFISFAYKYVQGYMRNLNRKNGLIHVPPKVKALAWKVDKLNMWEQEDSEIATTFQVSLKTVENCRIFFNLKNVLSMEAEKDGSANFSRSPGQSANIHALRGYENDLSYPSVEYYAATLDSRERLILSGLMGGDSYADIGSDLGISKARVGQLLKKIRLKVETQILKENR